jgi:hypothetical protein
MWLCLRRLKEEGKEGVEFGQYLYEIYNHDVELRVSKAGVCDSTLMFIFDLLLKFNIVCTLLPLDFIILIVKILFHNECLLKIGR